MINCPSCGSGLKYDIDIGKLKCDSCSNVFDPYIFDKETKDAETIETSIYICPGCGAELMWIGEKDITTYCPYCGNDRIIFDRIENEKRPATIIPFAVNKEECKALYQKAAQGSWFCPNNMKDAAKIESFRGIYMPYWEYTARAKGRVSFEGKENATVIENGCKCTKIFKYEADVDHTASGDVIEASAQFDKEISRSLSPYEGTREVPFTPGFLCGFYAEAAEGSDPQDKVAEKNAEDNLKDAIVQGANDRNSGYGYVSRWDMKMPEAETGRRRTMLPVWFMSYKNKKNKLSYITVNGSTGKVVADFPLSVPKVAAFTGVVALIIFLFFSLVNMTLTPQTALVISGSITAVSFYISFRDFVVMTQKKDFGDSWWNPLANVILMLLAVMAGFYASSVWVGFVFCFISFFVMAIVLGKIEKNKRENNGQLQSISLMIMPLVAVPLIIFVSVFDASAEAAFVLRLLYYLFAGAMIIYGFACFKGNKIPLSNAVMRLGCFGYFLITGLTVCVLISKPMNHFYYLTSLLNTALFFVFMIRVFAFRYKRAYRMPPQFDKKGGDRSE